MCGICGIFHFDGKDADAAVVREMADVMRHRGPDEDGFLADGPLAMGMRRLSIIDTKGGTQPIYNEDKTVATVQNGELYNFLEVTETLKAMGHEFQTRSDTEIIVHLYETYGVEFVSRLRGMFGIAVWDAAKRRLLLYRDRLGIKPLYYYRDGLVFAFASEMKSLMRLPGFDKEIDRSALDLYLTHGYIPGPGTIYKKVKKLPPGHSMSVDAAGVKISCYWRPDYTPRKIKSEGEAAERFIELFTKTMRQHLISDVPLGVFLSGGLDSSTIVAFMRELGVNPIESFSVGFSEKSYNELDYARQVARQFGTSHNELIVEEDRLDILPRMVLHFDEPFADSSAVPMYLISRFARTKVTVALSGEGGDETLAGYHTYVATKLSGLASKFPLSVAMKILAKVAPMLPTSYEKVSWDYKIKKFVENAQSDPVASHIRWKTIFSGDEIGNLLPGGDSLGGGGIGDSGGDAAEMYAEQIREILTNAPAYDILSRVLWYDTAIYLPDDLLVKNDRMSMANSLEARVPFLDHELVEFAAGLPHGLKLKGFNKKHILKKAMMSRLGPEIVNRKKAGFNIPLPKWLAADAGGRFEGIFNEQLDALDYPLDRGCVREMFAAHKARKRDCSRQLWTLLNFILWHNHYQGGMTIT